MQYFASHSNDTQQRLNWYCVPRLQQTPGEGGCHPAHDPTGELSGHPSLTYNGLKTNAAARDIPGRGGRADLLETRKNPDRRAVG